MMRRWQLIVIPIAVFFVVLISGILIMNFVIDNPTNDAPFENPSNEMDEPSNDESPSQDIEFDPKVEYANYLTKVNTNFSNKNIKAKVVVAATEYIVNSLVNNDGTELIEFTDNRNGFSLYTLDDAIYMYTTNTIDGEIINSWAKTEKDENYKPLTTIDDYFSVKNLENQIKNAKSATYKETVTEDGTTYDVLVFKTIKDVEVLDTFNLELTDEDITEHGISTSQKTDIDDEDEDKESIPNDGEEDAQTSEDDIEEIDDSEYTEYNVYVNRKTQEIEKITFTTDDYKATIFIKNVSSISLPNGAEIAEEITKEDFEFLLLGIKMAIVESE